MCREWVDYYGSSTIERVTDCYCLRDKKGERKREGRGSPGLYSRRVWGRLTLSLIHSGSLQAADAMPYSPLTKNSPGQLLVGVIGASLCLGHKLAQSRYYGSCILKLHLIRLKARLALKVFADEHTSPSSKGESTYTLVRRGRCVKVLLAHRKS